jgi:hypothetical protein
MGIDSRSVALNRIQPIATLVSDGKRIPLYSWSDAILSSVSVNANAPNAPLTHAR